MANEQDLASQFLEQLLDFLTEYSDKMTALETMDEVCAITSEYELSSEAKKVDEIEQERVALAEDDDELESSEASDLSIIAVQKNINKGFVLNKATAQYLRQHDMDEESFAILPPALKVKHRKAITALYNDLLRKEIERPTQDKNNLDTYNLFGKVHRKKTSEDLNDLDAPTDVQRQWFNTQIEELETEIDSCKQEIEELERQNAMEQVSSSIVRRNKEAIRELRRQIKTHTESLEDFQTKI